MFLNYRIFKSLIESSEYFENKPHIGVGVSGGPDSMALAYLLNKWIKYKKGKLTAIVFDHGIRHNSKIESLQVKKMLNHLGIFSLIIKSNGINNSFSGTTHNNPPLDHVKNKSETEGSKLNS